jgi:hypothetical protein
MRVMDTGYGSSSKRRARDAAPFSAKDIADTPEVKTPVRVRARPALPHPCAGRGIG